MEREQTNKLLEGLQLDLKNLHLEGKKKYPQVKEVTILWNLNIYMLLSVSSLGM